MRRTTTVSARSTPSAHGPWSEDALQNMTERNWVHTWGSSGYSDGLAITVDGDRCRSDEDINVSWAAPHDTGNSPLLRFEIQFQTCRPPMTLTLTRSWRPVPGQTQTLLMAHPAAPLIHHHPHGLEGPAWRGKRYVFRVRGVNATGVRCYGRSHHASATPYGSMNASQSDRSVPMLTARPARQERDLPRVDSARETTAQ